MALTVVIAICETAKPGNLPDCIHLAQSHRNAWEMSFVNMHLQVQPIVEDVRQQGDAAVKSYTKRFDRVDIDIVCVPIEVC